MHFNRRTTFELCILLSMFVAYTIASGPRTVNLRIGFDLSQGKNGAPLLRILNNDVSSEKSLRKGHEDHNSKHRNLRAVSSSDSEDDDDDKKKPKTNSGEVPLKPRVGAESADDSGSDSGPGDSNPKSTKGIKREDYEPEDNPRVHGKDDSDGGSSDRRKKRAAGSYYSSS